jgi:hypothetical protein
MAGLVALVDMPLAAAAAGHLKMAALAQGEMVATDS